MSFTKIWIHFVWATKNRKPVLRETIRKDVFYHIRENGKLKGIDIDVANGYSDHVHCLVILKATQTVSTVVQLLKGESAHWINKHRLIQGKFEWQDDFFAVSVSESGVEAVRAYINKQEEHHKTKTFMQEYEAFIRRYGFKKGNI